MNTMGGIEQKGWQGVQALLAERFGKIPDMEGILFLIGVNEYGREPKRNKFTKEQKQDLMHVAICTVLSASGFYEFQHKDEDGWPHFRQLKELPAMPLHEQENFLKDHILFYFEQQHF